MKSRLRTVSRCVAFLLIIITAGTNAATPATIQTQAELTRFLHSSALQRSPLMLLTPGGRERFLAQIKFYPHAVDLSYGEPAAELTHAQIVSLYSLFGEQDQAEALDIGLTAEQKSRFDAEHKADALKRGCTVQTCPESLIEQRFGTLKLYTEDDALPDEEHFAHRAAEYDRLFTEFQHPTRQRQLSTPDLRLLKRAADDALFFVQTDAHIAQLRLDLDELQRRGVIDDDDYASLHYALINARRFNEAHALEAVHPKLDAEKTPALEPEVSHPAGWPTALTVDGSEKHMRRDAFDLSVPLRIVVVASCHFSKDAARAIIADPELHPLFAAHAIWLASPSETFSSVADWNRAFPDQPIHLAWSLGEWAQIKNWAMPTFYVFRNGKITGQFSGWLGLAKLKTSLRQAGAMSP